MADNPFAGASTAVTAPVVTAPPKPKREYTVKDKPPFKGLLGDALGALGFWGTAAGGGARDLSEMLVGQKPDVRFQLPGQKNPVPAVPTDPAAAAPGGLAAQLQSYGMPAALSGAWTTYQANLAKSQADKSLSAADKAQIKSYLDNQWANAQSSYTSQQAQQPAALAYQGFYNNTVLPYLQGQQTQTNAELTPLFAQMQANIPNLPTAYQGAAGEAVNAMQAGALTSGQALQQNALNQPLLSQLLTQIGADISAQQAAQKAYAQSGAVGTAQAIQAGAPGAAVSIPAGF